MAHLTAMIGIPGSGKTTKAKELAKKSGNTVILCMDDIRDQLFGGLLEYKFSRQKEKLVKSTQIAMAEAALAAGQNIIIADTNINMNTLNMWKEWAKDNNMSFSKHDMFKEYRKENKKHEDEKSLDGLFAMYLKRCKQWNIKRLHSVPEDVIEMMFEKYKREHMGHRIRQHLWVEGLPKAVIFDIDGTLAHMDDMRGPFDWKKVGVDRVDEQVRELALMYAAAGYTIIVMSGRDGVCRNETLTWLQDNHIPFDHLFMRAEGDQRNDAIVKEELFFDNVQDKFNVHVCVDDRDRVVLRWREMGIKCFQVEPGAF